MSATSSSSRRPQRPMTVESFDFAVDPALRRWSRVFGIRPERCTVTLSPTELTVTFGMWTLSTVPANVVAVEVDGPYRWWKVAGPPRLSLADLGITFATNAESGVCIELRNPVGGLDPLHVAATSEPDRHGGRSGALRRRAAPHRDGRPGERRAARIEGHPPSRHDRPDRPGAAAVAPTTALGRRPRARCRGDRHTVDAEPPSRRRPVTPRRRGRQLPPPLPRRRPTRRRDRP